MLLISRPGSWLAKALMLPVLAPLLAPLLAPWLVCALGLAAKATDREAEPVAVCVVAPRVEAVQQGDALGVVPNPRPELVVIEPLLEVRLERKGQVVWQRQAPREAPISGPIPWPGAPLAPGELVLVRLRPLQAPQGSFAHVQLIGGSAERMASSTALMRHLAHQPQGWIQAIDRALAHGDVPLAWTLLFAPTAPPSQELQSLRQQVLNQGCGE